MEKSKRQYYFIILVYNSTFYFLQDLGGKCIENNYKSMLLVI